EDFNEVSVVMKKGGAEVPSSEFEFVFRGVHRAVFDFPPPAIDPNNPLGSFAPGWADGLFGRADGPPEDATGDTRDAPGDAPERAPEPTRKRPRPKAKK